MAVAEEATRLDPWDATGLQRALTRPTDAVAKVPNVAYFETDGVFAMVRELDAERSEPAPVGARGGKGRRYDVDGRETKNGILYTDDDCAAEGDMRGCLLDKTYVSHLGDWQTFTRRVWVEMLRVRFDQAATRVVLSDGADWIRSLCSWLPFTVLLILDMFHVKKRVAEAARALHPDDDDRRCKWQAVQYDRVECGNVDDVLSALKFAKPAGESARKVVDDLMTYLENNRDRMDYPRYRAMGLRVGSAAIESTKAWGLLQGCPAGDTARPILRSRAPLARARLRAVAGHATMLCQQAWLGANMSTSGDTRYCPVCGTETTSAHCAQDGVATVLKRRFGKDALSYGPGDLIADRYRITGVIGKGAYGAVYAAQHTGTGQPCALKLLVLTPAAAGDDVTRRFFQEARVTASLRHQNTIRVFDVGQAEDGPLFIAMELLTGPSMTQYLVHLLKAGSVMAESDTIDVLVQLLGSLAEAHKAGLVHRDIKPGNIILSAGVEGETVVKLLDFGIARTVDSSLTATGSSLGTPAYMSPEQCQGKHLDGRSDLYSVAILAYLCITGRLPFESRDSLALMFMQCSEPAPDPRAVTEAPLSDGFVRVIMRALNKGPEERFDDARAMRTALEEVRRAQWQSEPLFALDTGTAFDVVEMPGSDSDVRAAADDDDRPALPSEAPTSALLKVAEGDTDNVPLGLGEATAAMETAEASPEATTEAMGGATSRVTMPSTTKTSPPTSQGEAVEPPTKGPMRWLVGGAVAAILLAGLFFVLQGGEPEPAKKRATVARPAPTIPAAPAKKVTAEAPAPAAPKPNSPPAERPSGAAIHPAGAAAQSAPSTAQLEAKVAASLAEKAETLDKKIDYMREASKLDPDNTKYSNKLAELQAESNIQKRMRASEVAKAAARRKAMAKTRAQKPKPTKKEVPGEVQPIFAE